MVFRVGRVWKTEAKRRGGVAEGSAGGWGSDPLSRAIGCVGREKRWERREKVVCGDQQFLANLH
jgi:hypothetical protein